MNHPLETSLEPLFELFWNAYPKKVGKKAALKAWSQAVREAEAEIIISGALAYAADPTRKEAYTAHPATWLNAGRWLDEFHKPKIVPTVPVYDPNEEFRRRKEAVPMPEYLKTLLKNR